MFKKLQTKVVFVLCIIIVIISTFVFALAFNMLKDELMTAATEKAYATGNGLKNQFERLLSYGLNLEDIVGFDTLCEEVVTKNEDIEYALVSDLDGNILFTSHGNMDDRQIDTPEILSVIHNSNEISVKYMNNKEKYIAFIIPVFNAQSEHSGAVILSYIESDLLMSITRTSEVVLFLCFIMIGLIVIFISIALSIWVTKPLTKLYDATKKISDYGTSSIKLIEVTTNDEIGRLSESFNDMIESLRKKTVSKDYLDNILSSMIDVLLVMDMNKKIIKVNEAALELLGYEEEELLGQSFEKIVEFPKANDNTDKLFNTIVRLEQYRDYEVIFNTKASKKVPVILWCSVLKTDSMIQQVVCTAQDITERKKAEEMLMKHANYDHLTGLVNRRYLITKMYEILKDSAEGMKHCFLFLDLDRFKVVNDICGHRAGDQLLNQLGHIMQSTVSEKALLSRIGGDEFAIFFEDTTIDEAYSIANELRHVIKGFRFYYNEKIFNVGVSIGLVEIDDSDDDIENIIGLADKVCYLCKEKGGNYIQVYNSSLKAFNDNEQQLDLIPSLRKAFDNNRFFFNYQPIVDVHSKDENKRYEVLIRMLDQEGQVVRPDLFLPTAQRYKLLPEVDRWVIHNFMSHYHERISNLPNGENTVFNINISGISLGTEIFLDFVCDEIMQYNVPPHMICFEITETSAISNFTETVKFMGKLKAMGCQFALDDFGSGLSSFEYLKHLPVDYIKIGGIFIKNILKDPMGYAMVSSINEIAKVMGIKTIAEYVENEEIYKVTKDIGIQHMQGCLFSEPSDLSAFYIK